ncbi:hypothetical protein [Arthrobacter sp. ISL-72]|uniref:hypothetical protein n=1 Tax=Arthrobacter sp. ISL-72 TaxID=2819114 RepID=UPI001BECB328|nr:hypothetical protein [Arthrobacter sp. ISL-72]MBT2593838.1 hypothetical protein [Arthrobacter sp. ISL-72]
MRESFDLLEPMLSWPRDTRSEQFKEEIVRALGGEVRMEKIQTGQKLVADALAGALLLVKRSPEYKRRALHYLRHSWKMYYLSRALAKALEDSWEASSWPGDRLQVGTRMSRRVELITQRLQRENDAYAG